MDNLKLIESNWIQNYISKEDIDEYTELVKTLSTPTRAAKPNEQKVIGFANALSEIAAYIENSTRNKEVRAALAGICFAGPYICVNTKQLQKLMNRCKSSINTSLQHLGYLSVQAKVKTRQCLADILPNLAKESSIRQWTLRVAGPDARFCVVSSFPWANLPALTAEDVDSDDSGIPPSEPPSKSVSVVEGVEVRDALEEHCPPKELPRPSISQVQLQAPFRSTKGLYDRRVDILELHSPVMPNDHIGEYRLRMYAIAMKSRYMNGQQV